MKKIIIVILLSMIISAVPMITAESPTMPPPPSTLPSISYAYNGTSYTITDTNWTNFFTSVIDNHKYVTYNWSGVNTQYSIIFDLNYTGLNPYGAELVHALSNTGSPTVKNMTIAFMGIEKQPSLVKGYTNIKALDTGAYPGFSFSKPALQPHLVEYEEFGAIIAIIAGMIALYFIFNRKK